MECPITYELFEGIGENTPLMLSACGHTISAVAAAQLVAAAKAAQGKQAKDMPVTIKCPSCAKNQPEVVLFNLVETSILYLGALNYLFRLVLRLESARAQRLSPSFPLQVSTVNDLPRNLALIRRLREKYDGEREKDELAAERAGAGPPADVEAARKKSKRTKTTFTESGDHQPCVMPACGHTFTRVAACHLLHKASDSQQGDQLVKNLLPIAGACFVSILCIVVWPYDGFVGVLQMLLLCGVFLVRWWVKVRLLFVQESVGPCTVQCPACGTEQPEV